MRSHAGDNVFDLVRLLAAPREHSLSVAAGVEEHQSAGARAEELQGAAGGGAESADLIRRREEIDAQRVKSLELHSPLFGRLGLKARRNNETIHRDRCDEER